MTDFEHEAEVPVTGYGAQRRAAWLAGMQANADAMSAAEMDAYGRQRGHVDAVHGGMFGMTGQQMAADVSRRQATVGGDYGAGRPIARHEAYTHHLHGPCPPAADRRPIGQTGPDPDVLSSTLRYVLGER
jgi:hypothetical protein